MTLHFSFYWRLRSGRPCVAVLIAVVVAFALLAIATDDLAAASGVYDRGATEHASGAVYGNRYHVVRGALDTLGVDNRKQGRSKYGVRRPKGGDS